MKDFITLTLAVAVVVLGGAFFMKDTTVVVNQDGEKVGSSGSNYATRLYAGEGIDTKLVSYGNRSLATTTNGAGTFTASQLCDNSIIVATPEVGSVTLSVASSTAMFDRCLPNPGDERIVILKNASTTGTAILTLADTGANTVHLEEEGETTLVDVTEYGVLRFMNLDDTNMLFTVEIKQNAD